MKCVLLADRFLHHSIRVSAQMTRSQNFDVRPEIDWTIFLMLSIGCHVKFDASASKF